MSNLGLAVGKLGMAQQQRQGNKTAIPSIGNESQQTIWDALRAITQPIQAVGRDTKTS